jgi:hypothetical protein
MRMLMTAVLAMCVGLILMTGANFAQDKKESKKEVVLKGLVACNKCELGKSTECETVIVVKDAKSKTDIVYFFDKASHGKYHDGICAAAKNGTVTGTVKDVAKKKVVSVSKVAYE